MNLARLTRRSQNCRNRLLLIAKRENKDKRTEILTYHVVPGKIAGSQVVNVSKFSSKGRGAAALQGTRRGLHLTALLAKGEEQHVQKIRCIDSQRRVYFFSFLGVSLVWRVRFGQQGSCAFCGTLGALDIGGGHILQNQLGS